MLRRKVDLFLTPGVSPHHILLFSLPCGEDTGRTEKLKETGVPCKEFKKTNEGHSPIPDMQEVDSWFRKYLK